MKTIEKLPKLIPTISKVCGWVSAIICALILLGSVAAGHFSPVSHMAQDYYRSGIITQLFSGFMVVITVGCCSAGLGLATVGIMNLLLQFVFLAATGAILVKRAFAGQ